MLVHGCSHVNHRKVTATTGDRFDPASDNCPLEWRSIRVHAFSPAPRRAPTWSLRYLSLICLECLDELGLTRLRIRDMN